MITDSEKVGWGGLTAVRMFVTGGTKTVSYLQYDDLLTDSRGIIHLYSLSFRNKNMFLCRNKSNISEMM